MRLTNSLNNSNSFKREVRNLFPNFSGEVILTENMVAIKGEDINVPIKLVGAYLSKDGRVKSNGNSQYNTIDICKLCENTLRNLHKNLYLSEEMKHKIDTIHATYVNSPRPISGSYFTEDVHEMATIKNELNCSTNKAIDIMVEYLGKDRDEFELLEDKDEPITDEEQNLFSHKSEMQVKVHEKER